MFQQGPKENFDQLIRDGYCLIEDILQRLRQITDQPRTNEELCDGLDLVGR